LIFNFIQATLRLVREAPLIVCHCYGVSDRAIRRTVRSGAVTADHVARACGAGTGCGGCRGTVQEILASELSAASAAAPTAPAQTPAPTQR
jgi:bacterioferritin-associated ferredoxin